MARNRTAEDILKDWLNKIHNQTDLQLLALDNPCVKNAIFMQYFTIKQKEVSPSGGTKIRDLAIEFDSVYKPTDNDEINFSPSDGQVSIASAVVFKYKKGDVRSILEDCANIMAASQAMDNVENQTGKDTDEAPIENYGLKPFDRRLDRIEKNIGKGLNSLIVPMYGAQSDVATSGYLIAKEYLESLAQDSKFAPPNIDKIIANRELEYKQMINTEFYSGAPSLQNAYALIMLYGSSGGKRLINQKNQRKWYEVDVSPDQEFNFTSTPTTSALIDWGQGDPYGRTPYFFTDFVFSKYWNRIANNRLITLRRYPAPVYDNLKFPGMTGKIDPGSSVNGGEDKGSSSELTSFAPMASAITYFGGDTGNNLKELLKFTTGVEWGEVQGEIWNVTTTTSVQEADTGLGSVFPGLGKIAKLLNIGAGNFDTEYVAAGQLPPDPYSQGPFENRIQGPINRIDKVVKRNPGIKYENNLSIVFEYQARPVGGINTKAVLLDIMANFLVLGSASAVFFGGAHRFMIDPAKYPSIISQKDLYSGRPVKVALETINAFTGPEDLLNQFASNFMASLRQFWDMITSSVGKVGNKNDNKPLSPLGVGTTIIDSPFVKNFLNNAIAKGTAGQVAYLQGMKAILTGNPVGEWHLTIGNPLNPIAMIGNLVCDNMVVEFGDELGPDDFPTEIKVTVNLKHGMARDRDAIESIFNRGMGRIYNLPDGFLGSADYQTVVDENTKAKVSVGDMGGRKTRYLYEQGAGQDTGAVSSSIKGSENQLHSNASVWHNTGFHVGFSQNSEITPQISNEILRTAYRTADWIAQKAIL